MKEAAMRLAAARLSMSNWRRGIDDGGPSGAARALILDKAIGEVLKEIWVLTPDGR